MNKSVANGTFLGICCTHSVVHTVLVTVCVIIGCLDVYTLAKTAINMDACSVKMVSVDVDTCLFIGTNVIWCGCLVFESAVPVSLLLLHSIPCHLIPSHVIPFCHFIPSHIILFCHFIPSHVILFCVILSHPMSFHSVPFHPIPFYPVPLQYHSMSFHFILCPSSDPILSSYSIPFCDLSSNSILCPFIQFHVSNPFCALSSHLSHSMSVHSIPLYTILFQAIPSHFVPVHFSPSELQSAHHHCDLFVTASASAA